MCVCSQKKKKMIKEGKKGVTLMVHKYSRPQYLDGLGKFTGNWIWGIIEQLYMNYDSLNHSCNSEGSAEDGLMKIFKK